MSNHYQNDPDATPKVLAEGNVGRIPPSDPGFSHKKGHDQASPQQINLEERGGFNNHNEHVKHAAPQNGNEHNPFSNNDTGRNMATEGPLKETEMQNYVPPPKQEEKPGEKKKEPGEHVAYQTDSHLLSLKQLAEKYETDINFENISNSRGLTHEKSQELLAKNGKNRLSPPKQKTEIEKFMLHLLNFLNILLLGASVLCYVSYGIYPTVPMNLYLGIFLDGLVLFNVVIEYVQERSTSDIMGQFKKMLPPKCIVIRDGKEDEIKAEDLVLGDVVKIQGGKRIPADMRVIMSQGLKVEQSALNGESEEIEIYVNSLSPEIMDSKNLIFNGCQAIEGGAIGVVINTGDATYLGLVARQTTETQGEETEFQKQIRRFVQFVFIIGNIAGLIVFVIGVARKVRSENSTELNKQIVMNMFVNGFIVMIIANVPEGLPTTITMCLTIIAKKMAKRKVFIKKLECVEALGSASCIASDKTGTLTMNKMSVEHVWFDGHIYTSNYIKENRKDFKGNPTWKMLFKVACLCNKAIFKEPDEVKEKRIKDENENQQKEEENRLIEDGREDDGRVTKKSSKPLTEQKAVQEDMKKFRQSSRNLIAEYKKASGSFRQEVEIIGENTKQMANSQLILAQIREVDIEEEKRMMQERAKRKTWQVIGDASESALIRFCEDFKNTDLFKTKYEKIFEVPFNSKNKYQLSIHEVYERRFLVMKGAPEMIIKRCSHYMKHGESHPMDEAFMATFQKTYEVLGTKGERVLGCAYFELGKEKNTYSISLKNYKDEGLVFVGLYALMDPPKPGVEEAITAAREAFIKIMMVTGDHPLTAEAIARKVGIIRHCQTEKEVAQKRKIPIEAVDPTDALAKVVYGPDLLKYTQSMWDDLILGKKEIVFARISPQQKVEIVLNLQRLGEIVIVTGDGVNDAIALKKANIGVAMGEGGSDVAREASDVIFMDDNFGSIVHAVEEGRRLFDNLKKSIVYTVTHGNVEVTPVLLNIAIDMPLGLTSMQILSIDLGTELGPAISMSHEYAEDDLMKRPPRNTKTDRLVSLATLGYPYITASIIEIGFCLLAYFTAFWEENISGNELSGIAVLNFTGESNNDWVSKEGRFYTSDQQNQILANACTGYYITLVMSQFCHIWFCRTRQKSIFAHGFRNVVCNYGCLLELFILNMVVYIPAFHSPFTTTSATGIYWTMWIGSLIFLGTWNETRKYWTRKYPKGKVAKYFAW